MKGDKRRDEAYKTMDGRKAEQAHYILIPRDIPAVLGPCMPPFKAAVRIFVCPLMDAMWHAGSSNACLCVWIWDRKVVIIYDKEELVRLA